MPKKWSREHGSAQEKSKKEEIQLKYQDFAEFLFDVIFKVILVSFVEGLNLENHAPV